MPTITHHAGVHCHGKSRADWKLTASPLKAILLHILGVERYPGDEDISATILCILVSNLAVHHLQIEISHLHNIEIPTLPLITPTKTIRVPLHKPSRGLRFRMSRKIAPGLKVSLCLGSP